LRLLAEPLVPSGSSPDETLHGFFARRLGQGFAEAWLPALTAGALAAPPKRIGMDALPRLRRLEEQGGLLLGGLRAREHTCLPVGGTGALAQKLATRLDCVMTNRPAQHLEPLPDGRWRVHADGLSTEVDAVVLALPAPRAAKLLRPVTPAAAAQLASIPQLDLRVWHSRHSMVRGWERGFGLLIHPPEGRGLLGVVALAADDPRGVPGLLQLRTYLGGAYPVAPDLGSWPGVFRALRRWLPELGEPLQTRFEDCPGAFPLLEPGHTERMNHLLATFPPNLHWLGASRFGPGIPDLAEGIEAWTVRLAL
jgi:oxygen-dependent protoporphyrinogen oxidase